MAPVVLRIVPATVVTLLAGLACLTWVGIEPLTMMSDIPVSVSPFGAILCGLVVMTAWVAQRLLGASLAVVASAWLATSLAGLNGLPVLFASIALAAGPAALGGYAIAVATGSRRTILVGILVLTAVGLHAAGYQPLLDPACEGPCDQVAAPVASWLGARTGLGVALVPEIAAMAVVVGLALRSGASLVVRLSAIVGAVGYAAADAIPWWRWGALETTSSPDGLRTVAMTLTMLAIGHATVRRWQQRHALGALVRHLAAPGGSGLRGVTEVHYAVPGSDRWVDAAGRDVASDDGLVLPGWEGRPAVRLIAAQGLRSELQQPVSGASRLVLDNARLGVVARVRLADLRTSQSRIVAAADAERHRIERDLHDGAQQRLVGAAMHLAASRDQVASAQQAPHDEVQRQVHAALTGIRDISHGALLGVLGTEGLIPALEDLIETLHTSVSLELDTMPSIGTSVARAAYDIVVAGAASGTLELVRLTEQTGTFVLLVQCREPVPQEHLISAGDRVGATGGTLTTHSTGHVTTLTGSWPCAW